MQIHIHPSDGAPIYQQIVEQIKRQILTGALRPGEALPSMRAMAAELRVSLITTKRAFEELERMGLIRSETGRGSFVLAGADEARALRDAHWTEARGHLACAVREALAGGMDPGLLIDELKELLNRDE